MEIRQDEQVEAFIEEEKLLTANEVAKLLGVHKNTVLYRLVKNEGLPAMRIGTGWYKFQKSKVMEWIESKTEKQGEL